MYNFNSKEVNAQSLIHLINLTQTKDIVGVELGVQYGLSLCTIAQKVENLKLIYGIDPYLPYNDYLKYAYDGHPAVSHSEEQADLYRITTQHNIKFCGQSDKIKIIEKTAKDAVDQFEDDSLDFIFIDSHNTPQDLYEEMTRWYPKIKVGGIFAGHDVHYETIKNVVDTFRNKNNILNKMSMFDSVFVWIK